MSERLKQNELHGKSSLRFGFLPPFICFGTMYRPGPTIKQLSFIYHLLMLSTLYISSHLILKIAL